MKIQLNPFQDTLINYSCRSSMKTCSWLCKWTVYNYFLSRSIFYLCAIASEAILKLLVLS